MLVPDLTSSLPSVRAIDRNSRVIVSDGDACYILSRPCYGYFPSKKFSEYEYEATLTRGLGRVLEYTHIPVEAVSVYFGNKVA